MKLIRNKKIVLDCELISNKLSLFRGLRFSRKKNLVFDLGYESRFNTMIDMLFVFFPLDVAWLNANKEVVEVKRAFPFVSFIIPKKPARFVIEAPYLNLKKGEKINFR